jgi:hypothetical protein
MRCILTLALLISAACSSTGTVLGGRGDGSPGGDAGQDVAPFTCEIPAASPTLDPVNWQHPLAPRAGQTFTLALQSQNTKGRNAPDLTAEITDRNGTRSIGQSMVIGDARALYYFSFGALARGENCIAIKNGDNVEAAYKIVAEESPAEERGDGVWKIRVNHQWTCQEQPEWGNLLTVKTFDESGAPVGGVPIQLSWTDDTVYPVAPDDTAMSFAEHGQPKMMTTNEAGVAELLTPWGTGIRSPVDSKPGYVVFNVAVASGVSDVATEISTGIWENDPNGCDFCAADLRNTYGHWSYTVEFQRSSTAEEVCEVGIDHAGQQGCMVQHFYHEPDRPSCWRVAPGAN